MALEDCDERGGRGERGRRGLQGELGQEEEEEEEEGEDQEEERSRLVSLKRRWGRCSGGWLWFRPPSGHVPCTCGEGGRWQW